MKTKKQNKMHKCSVIDFLRVVIWYAKTINFLRPHFVHVPILCTTVLSQVLGKEFIKTGIFDKKFARGLNDAYNLRENSDYQPRDKITKKQAETYLNLAKEFLQAAKKYLEKFK